MNSKVTAILDWLRGQHDKGLVRNVAPALAFLYCTLAACTPTTTPDTPYLGASHVPDSMPGWQRFLTTRDPDAPLDEAAGGQTALKTPVSPRRPECFPAENRNVFYEVDQVVTVPGGALHAFDYTDGNGVTAGGRNAIRGQNTWMLWGEGNEAFWNWLQQDGYGLVDFLVLLDSRERDTRFARGGMINQPGMQTSHTKIRGLYLDEAAGSEIRLRQPDRDIDPATGKTAEMAGPPPEVAQCNGCHNNKKPLRLFEPGKDSGYEEVIRQLPQDGVDPHVYGYPSGVVGLRLFPNPDFFGVGPGPEHARAYWKQQVEDHKDDAYYTRRDIQQDPKLVRPFRVAMACAYCHLGPHPLNPPSDPEKPEWANLSSTIGNQYWSPQPLFANLTSEDSILYQFLRSQQPGTVDTSLVSTDHINNANTITAVFDVDARLVRASTNQPEEQSAANLLSPIAQLPFPLAVEQSQSQTPRHTPRVLLDGADSIGAFGALSRVYLNIGTFPEQWARCHNPIIGFRPQQPFALATLQANSVYWQTSEKYRIPYLAAFFTYRSTSSGQSIVAPMKVANVQSEKEHVQQLLSRDQPLASRGRQVFLDNCAICHSSRQPEGFQLSFSREWRHARVPKPNEAADFTLPNKFEDWEEFRHTAAFQEYQRRLNALVPREQPEKFFENNFLSTDVRVPVTLVGTNSGRAVGTNGMSGQVWDNFSSDTYKHLPAVGAVRFYNPFSGEKPDEWGNNDQYYPPPGGPGYYRPASLISVWATAPYLHNNSLGRYPQVSAPAGSAAAKAGLGVADPSVMGRLGAFDDGIDKLFSKSLRAKSKDHVYGDLRGSLPALSYGDPGFIYRLPVASSIAFSPKYNRAILTGLLGGALTSFVTGYLWAILFVVALVLVVFAQPRHAAFVLLVLAVPAAVLIALTRFDRLWPWLWVIPLLSLALALWLWLAYASRAWSRVIFLALALGFAAIGITLHRFVDGAIPISVGPIPQGTPINLLMNINPQAPMRNLIRAVAGLERGIVLSRRERDPARALHVFSHEAGQALLEASKCPDFVLDRGHWFAEGLTDEDKNELKAFLRTL